MFGRASLLTSGLHEISRPLRSGSLRPLKKKVNERVEAVGGNQRERVDETYERSAPLPDASCARPMVRRPLQAIDRKQRNDHPGRKNGHFIRRQKKADGVDWIVRQDGNRALLFI